MFLLDFSVAWGMQSDCDISVLDFCSLFPNLLVFESLISEFLQCSGISRSSHTAFENTNRQSQLNQFIGFRKILSYS